jgi:thiol:disulfide interchange protein DsbD
VRFLLDSDSAKLLSQRRFWLFARFEIPAGSHIYWENPGESGLATQVSFIAPPEVTIGTVQYPGPTRFAGYGSTTSYGYSNQVVLAAPVTVVADVDHPLEILASASWLSCSDVCVKEHAEARLILPPTRLTPAHQAPVLDLLPRPLPSGPQPNERGPGQTLVLRAPPDVELVEFFPLAPLGPEDDDCTSVEDEGGHSLRVQLRYDTPLDRPITGVVRALVDGQTRYFSVVVD